MKPCLHKKKGVSVSSVKCGDNRVTFLDLGRMDVPTLAGRGISCVSVMDLYSATTSITLAIKTKLFLVGNTSKNPATKYLLAQAPQAAANKREVLPLTQVVLCAHKCCVVWEQD